MHKADACKARMILSWMNLVCCARTHIMRAASALPSGPCSPLRSVRPSRARTPALRRARHDCLVSSKLRASMMAGAPSNGAPPPTERTGYAVLSKGEPLTQWRFTETAPLAANEVDIRVTVRPCLLRRPTSGAARSKRSCGRMRASLGGGSSAQQGCVQRAHSLLPIKNASRSTTGCATRTFTWPRTTGTSPATRSSPGTRLWASSRRRALPCRRARASASAWASAGSRTPAAAAAGA